MADTPQHDLSLPLNGYEHLPELPKWASTNPTVIRGRSMQMFDSRK